MRWTDVVPKHSAEDLLGNIIAVLGKAGPMADELSRLSPSELVYHEFSYGHSRPLDIMAARQIAAFYQKRDDLDLGLDREQVAFEAFLKSEELCRQTNARFRNPASLHRDVQPVLHGAMRKIARILGPCPSLEAFPFSFGPGASTSVKAAEANNITKLSASPTCSPNLAPWVGDFLAEVPLYSERHCTENGENHWTVDVALSLGRLQFVPKNAKTHRSIVVEPLLNGLFQKGVGTYMKERLLRSGINLYDQTNNQALARVGSIDGSLATIDLSSASDTVSNGIVWHLLPDDWATLLDRLRSSDVVYKGERIRLEKFSSMGNAYTFELESLIFHSLASATMEVMGVTGDLSVFGDDIILPVDCYDYFSLVLRECGFVVNQTKSFHTGNFRESCGKDYLLGLDIRPYFLKRTPTYADLFVMHNFFYRNYDIFNICDIIREEIPEHLRIYGPDGAGDGHLLGDYTLRFNRKIRRDGWGGGYYDTFVRSPRRLACLRKQVPSRGLRALDWVLPAYTTYVGASQEGPYDYSVVRGSSGYSRVSIYTLA